MMFPENQESQRSEFTSYLDSNGSIQHVHLNLNYFDIQTCISRGFKHYNVIQNHYGAINIQNKRLVVVGTLNTLVAFSASLHGCFL